MSRFLRLGTTPAASSSLARRSRGRSAIVDLVPFADFHRDQHGPGDDDDDDDFDVVRPSPTPSPPDSPGRQLAQFYLNSGRVDDATLDDELDQSVPAPLRSDPTHPQHHLFDQDQDQDQDVTGGTPSPRPDHPAANTNDSLLDFPPTPSTVHSTHSASNRSFLGSGASILAVPGSQVDRAYAQPTSPLSFSTVAARAAVPPPPYPLPLPVQVQVQHQPDDDPFGFALVERRIQLTRPYTQQSSAAATNDSQSPSVSVSVPPPSQKAPSFSLLFSSTPTQQSQQQQQPDPDSLILPPRPTTPLSSLHLTAGTPVRDSLDPTLHPPPFSATSLIHSPTSPAALVSPVPSPPAVPAPTTSIALAQPASNNDTDDDDDDDDIFTFKPTSRAAQTHSRVTCAMQAALDPMAAGASKKRQSSAAKKAKTGGPVARMAKTKAANQDDDVFEMKDDKSLETKTKQPLARRKTKARAPTTTKAKATANAKGPVQVTRFLGELIGMPSSSPSPPPPKAHRAGHQLQPDLDDGVVQDSGSDLDAHPIAKPTPVKKAPQRKRVPAIATKQLAGTENVDPFALPEDPPSPAKPKTGRRGGGGAATRTKRSSAERVAAESASTLSHAGDEAGEQGSPRKRTRTRTSGSGSGTAGRAAEKRATRSRRAAAQLEE